MKTVNVHEAKTKLSQLLVEVERGERVMIARAGKPIAEIVPAPRRASEEEMSRRFGAMRGRAKVPADFDNMCSDKIRVLFAGEDDEISA
ncbi:MAG: type II toxin-antitoxin system prevent-host-death family antitoxin [Cellulomonadaceae bacterium]|jgi:prevent-host-death family protein|nr:type II toxin-antitoxin system prevent-host-death family antitoxin [Cellulomonadaceae bacterium]